MPVDSEEYMKSDAVDDSDKRSLKREWRRAAKERMKMLTVEGIADEEGNVCC
jgi:hypothetical protein